MSSLNDVNFDEVSFHRAVTLAADVDRLIGALQEAGVLHSSMVCSCGKDMTIGKYANQDGRVWRCPDCKKRVSLRRNSYFEKSKIGLGKLFIVIYCVITRPKMLFQDIAELADVGSDAVGDWARFVRESVSHYFLEHPIILGAANAVQADESLFGGKAKYHRGDHFLHQKGWVFGMVEENTNRCVLWCVERRDRPTLLNLICDHCNPNTTVKTDCWPAYGGLRETTFVHRTVNHSVNFVAPDGTHTQMIEGLWSQIKPYLSMRRGTTIEDLPGYLDLFSMVREARYNNRSPISEFLMKIQVGAFY